MFDIRKCKTVATNSIFELHQLLAKPGAIDKVLNLVATPTDAALMMQLGCDGVYVGSGVFKSGDPDLRARAIAQAVTNYSDPQVPTNVSCGLREAMVGINLNDDKVESYANRSE